MIATMKKIIVFVLFCIVCNSVLAQEFSVPKDYKFEKKEDYKPYEPQIKEAIDWSLSKTLSADPKKRADTYKFFMDWLGGTPDVSVAIDSRVLTFMEKNKELLIPFMMGWAKYSLDNEYTEDKIKCNKAALEAVVAFYNKNRGFLKKDKEVEKYEKLLSKGKLEEELTKKLK